MSGSISKTAIWILLGLLILGLAGFGATNLSGTIRTVGAVGDKTLSVTRYQRELQEALAAESAEAGRTVTFAEAEAAGIPRQVLNRLITTRALDHEAQQMGLSIGDENLALQIRDIPAFIGPDGQFDRDAYTFALENAGLSTPQFEAQLRDETARTMLQAAIINGIAMPENYSATLIEFIGQERDFTWARLGVGSLEDPIPTPTEDELRAFHAENQDRFTLPETKRITYAIVTPDMILDSVEIDEQTLRDAYDERQAEFNRPERRLVERLPFLTQEDAASAKAQLEVSGVSFDDLVAERGLELSDVDMGDVSRLELDAAGEAVFDAEPGTVVGPLPSALGPALFRVNAVLPGQRVSFEDARELLRVELAQDRARRVIEQQAESYEDLLASGATLEDLARETDMQLGQIDWFATLGEGVAAYDGFRDAAAVVTFDDFPEIELLDDGSVFALRLDEELPQRPTPFDVAREDVIAAWESDQADMRLRAMAQETVQQLQDGATFAELGLDSTIETEMLRSGFVAGTPTDFLQQVFAMEPGEFRILSGFGAVFIVRLDEVRAPDDTSEMQSLEPALRNAANQALAQDIFDIFTQETTLRAGPRIDQQALQAVHSVFP